MSLLCLSNPWMDLSGVDEHTPAWEPLQPRERHLPVHVLTTLIPRTGKNTSGVAPAQSLQMFLQGAR